MALECSALVGQALILRRSGLTVARGTVLIGYEGVQIQQAKCMDSSLSNHGPPGGVGFGSKETDALSRGKRWKWKWK
ncbi:uncharacterized protein L3040_002579 [Drepanopeziza brunnea f. sp. 'multigermtubi']|uniref:uncharacterized protein n=1 Tax=Drepanopeziza brunnea f. sp. 'multigermtubi' TaxID=698441 RepID=UPI00239320EC|nr:hypothetical protein L3040_002579 [Drepanopeziza brunnea f. sp. 'multigermtubi']